MTPLTQNHHAATKNWLTQEQSFVDLLLFRVLQIPLSGSSQTVQQLLLIFEECYDLIYQYLYGESRKNELYCARYLDFLASIEASVCDGCCPKDLENELTSRQIKPGSRGILATKKSLLKIDFSRGEIVRNFKFLKFPAGSVWASCVVSIDIITKQLGYLTWEEAFLCVKDESLPAQLCGKILRAHHDYVVDVDDNINSLEKFLAEFKFVRASRTTSWLPLLEPEYKHDDEVNAEAFNRLSTSMFSRCSYFQDLASEPEPTVEIINSFNLFRQMSAPFVESEIVKDSVDIVSIL
uniref:Cilia- and flagella-associated protein 300 n=1 Tax=Macrostomum lignano TaxID=282301 RepID=A0A1I8F6S6_9PLAT